MERKLELRGGGELTVREEGNRVRFSVCRPADGRGLYKVWIRGGGGGRLLLGTLAPEDGALRLVRGLSAGELERSGCRPVTGGECVLVFPFTQQNHWFREEHPERLLGSEELRSQLRGAMLCRRENKILHLAARLRCDRPLPLETLFCLAHPCQIDGNMYLSWKFDQAGLPYGTEDKT